MPHIVTISSPQHPPLEAYSRLAAQINTRLCRILGTEVSELFFARALEGTQRDYPCLDSMNLPRLLAGDGQAPGKSAGERQHLCQGLLKLIESVLRCVRQATADVLGTTLWETVHDAVGRHTRIIDELEWPFQLATERQGVRYVGNGWASPVNRATPRERRDASEAKAPFGQCRQKQAHGSMTPS